MFLFFSYEGILFILSLAFLRIVGVSLGAEPEARLAQSVERQPFKLVVVGSSPTVGSVLNG